MPPCPLTRARGRPLRAAPLALAAATALAGAAPPLLVTAEPVSIVRARPGITGSGWAVAHERRVDGRLVREILHVYPNHPDDWGKTTGMGAGRSRDDGRSWENLADNFPIPGMVDVWPERLRDGTLLAFGLRVLPDRRSLPAPGPDGQHRGVMTVAASRDGGATWSFAEAPIVSPESTGPVARALPRLVEEPDGTLLLPAYSWNRQGNVALLLRSRDRGATWQAASVITTATAVRTAGVPVTSPWFENMVARVADGSLLAVIRTGSSARAALVAARSRDGGATWSPPVRLAAGPAGLPIEGKLPNLHLLPSGVLVLLAAHSRDHCRVYLSADGTGAVWSDAHVITSQTGGNTSLTAIDDRRLLVFTPATGRIDCWRLTIAPAPSPGRLTAPASVRADADGRVTWSASSLERDLAGHLVTPVLVRTRAGDTDLRVRAYAPVRAPAGATRLNLRDVLAPEATYRFEVAALDRDGGRSPAASSAEVTLSTPARSSGTPP